MQEDQNLTAKQELQSNFCVVPFDLKSLKGAFLK